MTPSRSPRAVARNAWAVAAAMIICRCAQRLRGLGALGLVLNCVTLWNTVYLDRALTQLRAGGYPVADTDAARLSAYQRRHINIHGHYTVALPDLGGTHRALRDPDQPDGQE